MTKAFKAATLAVAATALSILAPVSAQQVQQDTGGIYINTRAPAPAPAPTAVGPSTRHRGGGDAQRDAARGDAGRAAADGRNHDEEKGRTRRPALHDGSRRAGRRQ